MNTPKDRAELVRMMQNAFFASPDISGMGGYILAAIEAAGLRVVPVEATEEMVCAAHDARVRAWGPSDSAATFSTMLAASPFAPPQEPQA